MSSMQVSSGRPHMLTSNQCGRGKEPVVVLGRMRSLVAVNMSVPLRILYPPTVPAGAAVRAGEDIVLPLLSYYATFPASNIKM
jgi:hypothetical protein